jgi:hypothetical protein
MSKRVQQTIDVLAIVNRGKPGTPASVERLVALASYEVAKTYDVEVSTITAKFRRPTELGFNGMDDFRRAVSDWLFDGSGELENVLMRAASGGEDRRAIQRLFS